MRLCDPILTMPHQHGHSAGPLSARLPAEMPKEAALGQVSELLKLMSDPTRIRLFWVLCHGEMCVINLSALLDMSSPAVSHHLKLLKEAGLVISRREGREVCYTAAKTPRTEVLHDMIEQMVERTCPSRRPFEETAAYDSVVMTVNEVHDLLTSDLTKRYTTEELARRFHINPTTLKVAFKRVRGRSIAAYMKEYRIKRAEELLLGRNVPISEVAAAVGYESQSKFTQAFKSVTGMLPRDYRRAGGR